MELQNCYRQITQIDIDTLNDELEIQLPSDYAKFLLRHNGGQPKQNHFSKKDSKGESIFDFYLNVFFGIGDDDTSFDIVTMYAIYCDRIPEEFLPIGDDGVGNIICLGIEGNFIGKIFIWWKSGQVDEGQEPTLENIDLISESLEDFIKWF